jgi:hypothetical protein
MGKSGHVGGKIAATFASTGTPAFFMHPAEASHGDLGMITSTDVVVALSNSGESDELINILPTIKRIGAKVISITGAANSTLAKESDIRHRHWFGCWGGVGRCPDFLLLKFDLLLVHTGFRGSDQAWISSKTGNIISYLSSCNGEDPELKVLEADSVSVLESGKVESSENLEFNHRQALLSHILGKVDGIEVFLEVLSFKKNNCYFTINYTGKKEQQSAEQFIFKSFLNSFKVP